jgi:predicted nicotinamide N-methyase
VKNYTVPNNIVDDVAANPRARPDPVRFIQTNMHLAPSPSLPEIGLYTAHPATGLWRLVDTGEEETDWPPYWAYRWAGGTVLARYILDRPETVTGHRVLDLGAGSGVVGIAAAKAGAKGVVAADIDVNAIVAIGLNAAANGVAVTAIRDDLTGGTPPRTDLILVGDLFYDEGLAVRVTACLERCVTAGIKVLVGDPGRAYLPHPRLRLLAEYPTPDFGDVKGAATKLSAVYALKSNGA